MNEIYQYLKDLFKKNKNYISEEGELLIYKIVEDARLQTKDLIKFLLKDKKCKEYFFEKIDNITIFKSEEFRICINDARFLGNSFTRYLNKIGLMNNYSEKMIMNEDYIVLNYPYKDCMLDGGMTKEEAKRINGKETMINNILFKKDIHKLKSPKVLKNFRKFSLANDKVKESKIERLMGKENLLINGNNFAALCCLKEKFAGKVKLIYIDPPYNTGSDTFTYNDNFNHSAWLVFMKDRLKIAKELLLKDDGVIFIQCDDNEQAYLKVLMDEIFGRDNFVSCIIWLNKEGGGKSDSKHFRNKHEYILCYAKNKEILEIYPQEVEDIDRYKFSDKHEATRGKYQLIKLDSGSLGWVKSLDYSIKYKGITFYAGGDKEKWKDRQNGGASVKDWGWRWSKEKLLWGIENDFIEIKQNLNGEWNIYTKQYLNCDNEGNIIPRKLQPMAIIEKHSNTQSNRHMKSLFEKNAFNYSKPEGLVYEIFNIATKEGDLILDFFAGSGTTLAVAHKMNRQYIGVEQIERHFEICIERLKKVIEGEQGGISKKVDWKGGGEFICCDIATYNADWIKKIRAVKNDEEFEKLFEDMKENSVINHRLKIDYLETDNLLDDDFKKKDLEEKKSIMLEILDKNIFYVPFSERKDKNFNISDIDIKVSEEFYNK